MRALFRSTIAPVTGAYLIQSAVELALSNAFVTLQHEEGRDQDACASVSR